MTAYLRKSRSVLFVFFFLVYLHCLSQKGSINYIVKMENPEWHFFQVELTCSGIKKESIDFKMPVWTPGYYQKMDYAGNVKGFAASTSSGTELKSEQVDDHTWRVFSNGLNNFKVTYEIKTERAFVASPYVDETRAYILPAGVFLYINNMIKLPVQVKVVPYEKWNRVVTGMDSSSREKFTYTAPDFDILYDSPILTGNLEELPFFKVRGVTHRFIGYKLGDFDKQNFMMDLRKVVEAAVNIFGTIPYKNYTFIAIGPGPGGIEHLNNTTFGFNGSGLDRRESYIRMMHFLAHEYFHHFNVKRVRPVELGPFDYEKGSRTKMLWLSEGFSVYYEYLVVRRAGITTNEEFFNALRNNINAFESKPGKLYQTLEEASYETWSDGPFGRTGDEINKTISYYDKGPVVGLLFDLKIRELTQNKKSLDDVMRYLYKEYYQRKKRGFTDDELKQAFKTVSGFSLDKEFNYISTTKPLEYPKYFAVAGLAIDTTTRVMPGAYAGFSVRNRADTLFINNVDWLSPAWDAGMRRGQELLLVNKADANADLVNTILAHAKVGDKIKFTCLSGEEEKEFEIRFVQKTQITFTITPLKNIKPLQKQILESWLKG